MEKNNLYHSAKNITLIAVMSASIIGGKLALSFLPNVEIVTLLCALYGFVFGFLGLASVFIFVLCEMLLWGFGSWVLTYFIYWPLVCIVFIALKKMSINSKIVFTVAAAILTIFFGILSSLIDVGLFMGFYENFWYRFSIYYMRGITFYLTQIITNLFTFMFLFKPLRSVLQNIKNR